MSPKTFSRMGKSVALEATLNGRRNAAVRIWQSATDMLLLSDELDLSSYGHRARLVRALPTALRSETAELLADLAKEAGALDAGLTKELPKETAATVQPDRPKESAQVCDYLGICKELAWEPELPIP